MTSPIDIWVSTSSRLSIDFFVSFLAIQKSSEVFGWLEVPMYKGLTFGSHNGEMFCLIILTSKAPRLLIHLVWASDLVSIWRSVRPESESEKNKWKVLREIDEIGRPRILHIRRSSYPTGLDRLQADLLWLRTSQVVKHFMFIDRRFSVKDQTEQNWLS